MNWILSLFHRKRRIVPGRTRDSVIRNRKFNMPLVWYNVEHLHAWSRFLRARCAEGAITYHKLREKIRAASRSVDRQRHLYGSLPGERSSHDFRPLIARELARKL